MPDLLGYAVNRAANKQLTVPTWDIVGRIVDSTDQSIVIRDLAGVSFPQVLGNLTAPQQDEWVASVVQQLIFKRFGL
jgi:hypothetical protein